MLLWIFVRHTCNKHNFGVVRTQFPIILLNSGTQDDRQVNLLMVQSIVYIIWLRYYRLTIETCHFTIMSLEKVLRSYSSKLLHYPFNTSNILFKQISLQSLTCKKQKPNYGRSKRFIHSGKATILACLQTTPSSHILTISLACVCSHETVVQ